MPKLISEEKKQKVKELAQNNYLRQGDIAKILGISRPTVSKLLSKKTRKRAEKRHDAGLPCPITGFRFY